jgi:hypothetical protein
MRASNTIAKQWADVSECAPEGGIRSVAGVTYIAVRSWA